MFLQKPNHCPLMEVEMIAELVATVWLINWYIGYTTTAPAQPTRAKFGDC